MSIKRILCLILCLSMVLTSFAAAFAAEEAQDAAMPYDRAVSVLSALGIMQGKSETDFGADDFLTRAEMSTVAVRFVGLDAAKTDSGESSYADVGEDHWGKSYINTATQLSMLQGNGDGSFSPEEETTAEQAIKILVCALGYEPMAEEKGGYPTGYLTVASQLGLLQGIDFAEGYSAPIKRWKIAMLVYNALDVELMQVITYGDEPKWEITKDVTALSKYHKAEKKTGTVSAAYTATMDGAYTESGEVLIDDVSYDIELNIAKYIGYSIDFYCTIESEAKRSKILAFFPVEDRAQRTEISFDDVKEASITADGTVSISYYPSDSGKLKTVTLKDAVYMYNGKIEKFETDADAQAFLDAHQKQGQFVVLRGDGGDRSNVLFIENYNAYVISNINAEFSWISYNIYTADGIKRGVLDLSNKEIGDRRVFYYDENGNEIILGDLTIGDVIMVYESSDSRVIDVHRSMKRVTGMIQRRETLDGTAGGTAATAKTYETISEIDFSNITGSQYSPNWLFASTGTTADGLEYRADLVGNGGYISQSSNYWVVDALADDAFGGLKGRALPEISSGMLLRMTRGQSDSATPTRDGIARLRHVFDNAKVKVGDRVRITTWVYTDDIWDGVGSPAAVGDQENATTALLMYLSVERDTGKNQAGYNHNSYHGEEGVKITNLKNHEWVPVSFEYEVTRGNYAATDIRIDGNADNNGHPFSRNIFFAGVKVEKVTGGVSDTDRYEFPEDNARYKLYVDGTGYEPEASLYSSLIETGKEATLLLDLNNKVVGYIQNEDKAAYGLLMDVAVKKSSFSNTLLVKIMENDGEIHTYETLEKVKAWTGADVGKVDAVSLITDQPADPMTSHYLWSTNNASQFTGVYHSWMSDQVKSDAASRKIVYFEANSKGEIHTILVPSMPEDHPDAKIVMLHNFGWHTNPWLSYNNVSQSISARMLSYVDGTYLDKEEYTYLINNFALVYEAVPMDYDETDYRLVKGGVTSLASANLYDGMDWSNAQLYRMPGSNDIDFMVINPKKPSNGSEQHKVVIVDSIDETVDGYQLEGYYGGQPYSMPIKENTRLMEHILITSLDDDWQYVTKDMLPQMAEEGKKPYNVFYESDVMGNRETPYVRPDNVFKGDVVRVLERDGEITSLEIVRRKSTGVVTMYNATYPGSGMYGALMQWNTCVRGEIVDIDDNLNIITVKGYYHNGTNPVVSIDKNPIQSSAVAEFTTFIHFTNSNGSVYDLKSGRCYPAAKSDYHVGDEIFTWKYLSSPSDVIVFKDGEL